MDKGVKNEQVSLRIDLMVAELNYLEVKPTDTLNMYVTYSVQGKVCKIIGPDFVLDAINKALKV